MVGQPLLEELQRRSFANASAATRLAFPDGTRMSNQKLCDFLDGHRFAVVSTTRGDGRPHAVPASYIRRDATLWLPTVKGSVRERNVRRVPWLVLVVAEGDRDTHRMVMVEGPAGVVPADAVPPDVAAGMAEEPWVSRWLRLTAERLLSYDGPAD
ncbi:MAG TPA: pyridoxamine 5'-phosphate oxidase family protein [Nocardioidaceae bacterium]|nr:pyridoxamine 5'-phosphate oxidase family protein [Nocardioidaceae bacterium]